jgi:CubicO group peptidase (beta-lactamase class C family)
MPNIEPKRPQIDELLAQYDQPASPGCALAVMQGGEVVYQQGYGLANLETGTPITPTTVFNIGSTAKQFTAFAIALLVDEGKLSLDDDIRQHLPEMPDLGEHITIRHLIHHTSGLRGSFPELLALAEWRDTDATTTDDVYGLLKAQRRLNFRPGEEHLYVNSNYVLLALICEQASGQPFAELCRERLFEPLGMSRTVVNDSYFKLIPGRASGYYGDDGTWFNAPLTDSVVGPTNIYSTVEDLARWDENFYSGRVGGEALVEMMHQPGRLNDGTVLDYAFGLMVGPAHQRQGWQMVEHGGSQGGYSSWLVRFPELHLSVVVLLNLFMWDMREVALRIADLFLQSRGTQATPANETSLPVAAPASIELSAGHLARLEGTYLNRHRAALRQVTVQGGKLQFEGHNLAPLAETLFCFEVEPETRVIFSLGDDGRALSMKTLASSGEYGYDRVETTEPTVEQLADYAGRYHSPELDVSWTLVAGDRCLIARRRKYVESTMTPVFVDGFRDDWQPIMGYPTTYLVVFQRDPEGALTGLRVSGSRVRHLAFERLDSSA